MMNMSRRLVLGVAFAGIGANSGLMAWALRRCKHELPFLQSEIQHSQQAMLQLEKYYRDGVHDNTLFEELRAQQVRHGRAVEKFNMMQKWIDSSMLQKFVTWPLLIKHV